MTDLSVIARSHSHSKEWWLLEEVPTLIYRSTSAPQNVYSLLFNFYFAGATTNVFHTSLLLRSIFHWFIEPVTTKTIVSLALSIDSIRQSAHLQSLLPCLRSFLLNFSPCTSACVFWLPILCLASWVRCLASLVLAAHHLPALIYGFFGGKKNISCHERILQGLHRNQ